MFLPSLRKELSNHQKIAKVEEYKECLDNESKGVEETITELESD